MRTFKDELGHEWRLSFSYAAIKRFAKANADCIKFFCDEACDLETLVRILWVWLEPQIDEQNIDEEAFAERLCGDALSHAYIAARLEVLDFLSHMNPPLAAVLRKAIAATDLLMEKVTGAVDAISLPSASSSISA